MSFTAENAVSVNRALRSPSWPGHTQADGRPVRLAAVTGQAWARVLRSLPVAGGPGGKGLCRGSCNSRIWLANAGLHPQLSPGDRGSGKATLEL